MPRTLAIMFTMTTYGTWLRGDQRNWVEDGIIYPPNPSLESADRDRMKHPEFLFPKESLHQTAAAIAASLTTRLSITLHALALQSWHTHFLVAATEHDVSIIAKCAKDAARYHLRPGRPIWVEGYDKRFCYNFKSVQTRITYIERHNLQNHLPPNPFGKLITPYI